MLFCMSLILGVLSHRVFFSKTSKNQADNIDDFVTLNTIFLLKLLLHCKSQINTSANGVKMVALSVFAQVSISFVSLSQHAVFIIIGRMEGC